MGFYFLDTSGAVKRYVDEIGTAWVQALTAPSALHSLFVARIIRPEAVSAVTRRERGGSLTAAAAVKALTDFQHDFTHQYFVVEMSAAVIDHAAELARRHGLRAYDSVQLAAALEVQTRVPSLVMVSADDNLNAAAISEGLSVDDPKTHP